eukprot:361894-Chlamydomonas_euryale.AAC.15
MTARGHGCARKDSRQLPSRVGRAGAICVRRWMDAYLKGHVGSCRSGSSHTPGAMLAYIELPSSVHLVQMGGVAGVQSREITALTLQPSGRTGIRMHCWPRSARAQNEELFTAASGTG